MVGERGVSPTVKGTGMAWDLVKTQILTPGAGALRSRVSGTFPGRSQRCWSAPESCPREAGRCWHGLEQQGERETLRKGTGRSRQAPAAGTSPELFLGLVLQPLLPEREPHFPANCFGVLS